MAEHTQPGGATLGVIGGSGLYELPGLEAAEEVLVDTPYGKPSDAVVRGRLGSTTMLFLPRHGRGHRHSPSDINYRANVCALKKLGATHLVSVSAVGSMQERIRPGDLVVVDQFIDLTKHRKSTFFDDGIAAHVAMADPVCPLLAESTARAGEKVGAVVHRGGTYVCIEGPQFSTRAESMLYRSWGVAVIGMTNMPEAKLAREAELPYATVAIATDYDCWHQTEEAVSVAAILAVLRQGLSNTQKLLVELAASLPDPRKSPAFGALAAAVLTDRSMLAPLKRLELDWLI
jgi:5'-methylthioadenosine phosphorylase